MAGAPEHFDCIVVGTGFGGSVTAQRLAEADRRVLVLERGKAYPPGSFPRSPIGFKNNLWDPSEGLQGLFDLWSFSGLDALISSGLGGGSLIYANVLLRKDEKWFVPPERPDPAARPGRSPGPTSIRTTTARSGCSPRSAIRSSTRPTTARRRRSRSRPRRRSANMDWFRPPLAVTFANPGEDPVRESRSRRSGPTSTDARGRPAGSSASATSAATTGPRTRSTTTTSPRPGTTARRSARAARCASSSRARAAAGPSTTSSTPTSTRGTRRTRACSRGSP